MEKPHRSPMTAAAFSKALPDPFTATRYHSLCILNDSLPTGLRITATSEDGVIQGIAHREFPICGVQFHPESILSEQGDTIARNFLHLASIDKAAKA